MRFRLVLLVMLGFINQAVAQAQPDTLKVKTEVEETSRPYKGLEGIKSLELQFIENAKPGEEKASSHE